jgi:hypothetical protein
MALALTSSLVWRLSLGYKLSVELLVHPFSSLAPMYAYSACFCMYVHVIKCMYYLTYIFESLMHLPCFSRLVAYPFEFKPPYFKV